MDIEAFANIIAGCLPMFRVKPFMPHQKVGRENYNIHMDSKYQIFLGNRHFPGVQ